MPRLDTVCSVRLRTGPATTWRPLLARLRAVAFVWWALSVALVALPARAEADVQLLAFELTRDEEGVYLTFASRFDLPRGVEEALLKGVPLHFEASAEVYRSRWWWLNPRVAHATRTWRLAWQPLTRSWRVSFGGLNQSFETLPDALAALRSAVRWKIADAAQIDEGARHYVEFSYRLDTTQLPRPMQIGVAGQSEWILVLERSVPVP